VDSKTEKSRSWERIISNWSGSQDKSQFNTTALGSRISHRAGSLSVGASRDDATQGGFDGSQPLNPKAEINRNKMASSAFLDMLSSFQGSIFSYFGWKMIKICEKPVIIRLNLIINNTV
jgi:hypothetical protein